MNNITELHIEPTNICTLKCPGCSRTQFIEQFPSRWKNYSIDPTELMNFIDVDISNITMVLCGVYGDPIYHPDFHNLIKEIKNRQGRVRIITNGSYQKPAWWEQLTGLLDARDRIVFSIDGLPDNFTQYRINANWPSIKQAIEIVAASDVYTVWKYIPFKFNQHNIEQARELSKQLNMDAFFVDPSSRFDEKTEYLIPESTFIDSKKKLQDNYKQGVSISQIDPQCAAGDQHYISADGFYSPCCFAADHRFYYKTQFGKNRNEYNIRQTTLSQLLKKPNVVSFYENIHSAPPGVCQYNCAKKS